MAAPLTLSVVVLDSETRPSNEAVRKLADLLDQQGYEVRAVVAHPGESAVKATQWGDILVVTPEPTAAIRRARQTKP